jgi:signal transduction histidine kinase
MSAQPVTVVLDNLVENAVKFNSGEEPKVELFARRHVGDWVEIAVRDNGPGIPAEHQQKVFEKFYQVEKYYTGKVSGAGLGLPLARRIVESLGGKIWVESRLGEGSTFTFTAPVRSPGTSLEEPPPPRPPSSAG